MNLDVICHTNVFGIAEHREGMCTHQRRLFFFYETHLPVRLFPLSFRVVRLLMNWVKQNGDSVVPALSMSAQFNVMSNTPPQVDIFKYINRKANALRKQRRKKPLLVPHKTFHVSSLKKAISYSSHPFSFMLLKTREYSYLYYDFSLGPKDMQTYFPPVVRQGSDDDQRISSHHIVLEMQGQLLSAGDQKKKEKQPAPEKPKTKQSKTRREGDKGSKEGKEPNTDGLVAFP